MFNGFRRLWLTISSSLLKPMVVFWVFFRTAPFYGGKIGFKLTSLSVFKTPCVTAYQRYIVSSCILGFCVLLRGYSRVPEHVRTTPGPAVDRGGQAGEIFQQCLLSFSAKTFDKQILGVYKPPTYVWSLFMHSLCVWVCVCRSGSWRLQNGGHPEPLVKLHLHQNHRPPYQTSFPSSQPASQPTTRRATLPIFLCRSPVYFSCFCVIRSFFII